LLTYLPLLANIEEPCGDMERWCLSTISHLRTSFPRFLNEVTEQQFPACSFQSLEGHDLWAVEELQKAGRKKWYMIKRNTKSYISKCVLIKGPQNLSNIH
jgi:hypothetical protein